MIPLDDTIAEIKKLETGKAEKLAIINVGMPSANTEYRWQFPKGCKGFAMQCRDGTAVRFATRKDIVAKPNPGYATLKADASFDDTDLDIQSENQVLYFACGSANKVVEIVVRM